MCSGHPENRSRLLLTGPPGSGKTRKLLDFYNSERQRGTEDSGIFILPDASAREHVRDILARPRVDSDAKIPRAFADSGIHSLHSLTASLASRQPGSHTAGVSHLRALLMKWIENGKLDSGEFPILSTRGGIDSLASAITQLRADGYTSGNLSGRDAGLSKPLRSAMILWEEWLDDNHRNDDRDVLTSALKAAQNSNFSFVLIDGFTEFRPLQWMLIETLVDKASHAAVAIDPDQLPASGLRQKFLDIGFSEQPSAGNDPHTGCEGLAWLSDVDCWDIHAQRPDNCPCEIDPGHLKIISAGDPRIEASCLAREVAACLGDGYSYPDIAILVPNLGRFRRVLSTEFDKAGIPLRFYLDLPLAETCVGTFFIALLGIIEGDWSDEQVTGFLSHPFTGLTETDKRSAITQTQGKYRLGSHDNWLKWSDGEIKSLLGHVHALALNKGNDLAEFTQTLIDIGEEKIRGAWCMLPDRVVRDEGWAWDRIRSVLLNATDVLSDTNAETSPLQLARYMRWELSRSRGKPLDRRRDCVNAVTFLGARTWRVPVAMVGGLAREYFPRRMRPNPFLPDTLRTNLNPPLPTYDELRRREEALFRIAVTRATDRLVLTSPAYDLGGSPLLVSGPLQKLAQWVLDGKMPEPVFHDPPLDQQQATFPSDIIAFSLENAATGDDLEKIFHDTPELIPLDPVQTSEYEIARTRCLDALVEAACGSKERPISPTGLNHLAQCPYRFFASRVLGIVEPSRDRVSNGFDNLMWGTIAHAALAEWSEGGRIGDFEGIVRGIVNTRRLIVPGSVTEARIAQIVRVLKRYKAFEDEFIRPLGYVQKYSELVFDTVERRKGVEGFDPVAFRIDDRYELIIGGRIDRLDIAADNHAIVLDYKRSKYSIKDKAVKEAYDFQLAFYVALVTEGLGLDVDLAGYLPLMHIGSVGAGKMIFGPGAGRFDESVFKRDDDLARDTHMQRVRERIVALIDGISSGEITPNPRDPSICGSQCPYNALCRYRFTGDEGKDEGGDS